MKKIIVDQMFDFEKRSFNLSYDKKFAKLNAKKTIIETKKIVNVVQIIMKQKIVVVVIETIKFEICVKNINFFDFFMMMNLLKLHFFVNCANFFQKLNVTINQISRKKCVENIKNKFSRFCITMIEKSNQFHFVEKFQNNNIKNVFICICC